MKTIIITDPCYILSDEEWDNFCEEGFGDDVPDGKFEQLLLDRLREISGDKKAVVGTTGFGDWENEIQGKSFYADSGLVCVVELSPNLQMYMKKNKKTLPLGGAAILEVPKTAFYELNFLNPSWTKIIIWDDNFKEKIAESLDEPSWS